VREVPDCASSGNNELEATDQEGINPETTKEMIEEDVAGLL
jgi:hypothetical protein